MGGLRDAGATLTAGWDGLGTLIRVRLLVAALALPFGILLRPDRTADAAGILGGSLAAVGVISAVFLILLRLRRGLRLQQILHVAADLGLITFVSAHTGGRDSQFVLFYALVVINGGVMAGLPGGLFGSAGACAGFVALPWLGAAWSGQPENVVMGSIPRPELLVGFLALVGALAGVLGERVHRTRDDLARTERELYRVRVDNDAILRHLATGVFTVDHEGLVAYLNPAAELVLGIRALEVRGRHVSVALPERLTGLRRLVLETLGTTTGRSRAELLLQGPTGRQLPLGISTNVLMHEGAITGVVAVFQDLTEVREMERRARRNETLAEVGALAAGVAHELRNGLKPISGSVEYLQRELKLEGENAELMGLIARESARLNKFVSDLLTYSRDRDLALEPVELGDQLRELVSTLRHDPRRAANVSVRLECPEDAVARADVDREQIRQVWLNLAANALEAMSDRGELTVRWRPLEPGQLAVEFLDDGPGIAAEDLPRVGEPFFTTKRGGTGLGLAIAQRIVERHGGVLTLESEAGRGTCARVQLPGACEAVAQAA
jgi:two-component system sensor histidine kinase PilS (NtrC family)